MDLFKIYVTCGRLSEMDKNVLKSHGCQQNIGPLHFLLKFSYYDLSSDISVLMDSLICSIKANFSSKKTTN